MVTDIQPRFRGKVIDVEGGFSWELFISELGCNEGTMITSNESFLTFDDSLKNLKKAIKHFSDFLAKETGTPPTTGYIDMKSNERIPWETN